jgi:hypothetical protein
MATTSSIEIGFPDIGGAASVALHNSNIVTSTAEKPANALTTTRRPGWVRFDR